MTAKRLERLCGVQNRIILSVAETGHSLSHHFDGCRGLERPPFLTVLPTIAADEGHHACYLVLLRSVGREHAHGRGCCRHGHLAYLTILYVALQRYFVQGVLDSALKDGALKRSNLKAVRALSRCYLQLSSRSDLVHATDRRRVRRLMQQLRVR